MYAENRIKQKTYFALLFLKAVMTLLICLFPVDNRSVDSVSEVMIMKVEKKEISIGGKKMQHIFGMTGKPIIPNILLDSRIQVCGPKK